MGYPDDLVKLYRLEKMRVGALVLALSCTLLEVLFDLAWLAWPRAFAWLIAACVGISEVRTLKRMGRDPDAAWLRVALGLVAATYFFVVAARN